VLNRQIKLGTCFMETISRIKNIKAREILDSRGNPTLEVKLETNDGVFVSSVPSGASKGKNEAVELRDGGDRYLGKGVLKAVKNVNKVIAPKLTGKNATQQGEIDELMIELDGREDKSKLGANAILAVSMAVCRAGAAAKNIPLWKYISYLFLDNTYTTIVKYVLPFACFNIINGGAHAGNKLDIQEFMVIPQKNSFSENLRTASEIYYNLKKVIEKNFGKEATNVGDEGGFAPPISRASQALNLISQVLKKYSGTKIGLDCAATQFKKQDKYQLEGAIFTNNGLLSFYEDLIGKYPIIFLEDPFAEGDWRGWKLISSSQFFPSLAGSRCGGAISNFLIVGDDLLTTNPKRIKSAREKNACNGAIIKPNQIGTITETLEAVRLAKSFDWKIVVSHRSGETGDDFIADLAVGVGADFIKSGAPTRGERVAKYNRLLEIEKEAMI
jgi:enolase